MRFSRIPFQHAPVLLGTWTTQVNSPRRHKHFFARIFFSKSIEKDSTHLFVEEFQNTLTFDIKNSTEYIQIVSMLGGVVHIEEILFTQDGDWPALQLFSCVCGRDHHTHTSPKRLDICTISRLSKRDSNTGLSWSRRSDVSNFHSDYGPMPDHFPKSLDKLLEMPDCLIIFSHNGPLRIHSGIRFSFAAITEDFGSGSSTWYCALAPALSLRKDSCDFIMSAKGRRLGSSTLAVALKAPYNEAVTVPKVPPVQPRTPH